MSALNGIEAGGGYVGFVLGTAGDKALFDAEIDRILAVIPDPDNAPANSGVNDLDVMSPSAAASTRAEILALQASITGA